MSVEEIIEQRIEKDISDENIENNENNEKEEKEVSQGEQDIQNIQPKEEKIQEVEDNLEVQESKENKEPEPEIIIFSNLSKEEKIKYFNYFISNDTVFNREEEGTWIAEIDIIDEEAKQESNSLLLSNKNSMDLKSLRQSKFRSTKKDYDTIYSKLISVINPPQGVKGTKMDINAIKLLIQEIYSLKFLKDTQALLSKEEVEPDSFPTFVGNFLINKFPKKEMLYKKSIDFMLSLDFYGMKHKDIKIFQQFVTEEYDSDDLIFYLFVRSCIEKEQKQLFLEKAKENLSQGLLYGQEDDDILVPVKKSKKLAKAIFGNEEEELMDEFLENIQTLVETEPADDKKKYLKANSILNMALMKYHESRDKIEEEKDEKKEKDEKEKSHEEEKSKEEEQEEEEEEDITPNKKSPIIKGKTVINNKKPKEMKKSSEKSKIKKGSKEENYIIESNSKEPEDIDDVENNKLSISQNTKLRSNKKSNLKSTAAPTNQKAKISISTNPKNPMAKQPKTTISKNSNSIKVSNINNKNPKTSMISKPKKVNPTDSTRTNKTSIFSNSKISSSTTSKPARKNSQETRKNVMHSGNRTQAGSSVGKRVTKKTIQAFNLEENKIEQTPEFKKILNKNRIEKVKSEAEKAACLCYIISDYFKLKEVDNYFKNIIEQNSIFQSLSSKIYTNLKTPKEFLLKKLNGICKYISVGDKNGFYNFMKIKDKNGKSNFEGFKSNFNALLRSGPLKNLDEIDIGNFCKSILEMPELSLQTTKSLLKLCE